MRKLTVLLMIVAAASFGAAFAQAVLVPLDPTTGGGGTAMTDGSSAHVDQTVNLTLPTAYGIAIDDAATLSFDLSNLTSTNGVGGELVCVTGIPNDKNEIVDQVDATTGAVKPLGTFYSIGASFPDIIINGGEEVTQYPPVVVPDSGAIDLNSKRYFVCYKSFILEKFANVGGWNVTVSRSDDTLNALGDMFLQDNMCSAFGADTKLFPLLDQGSLGLFQGATDSRILASLAETTGEAANGANDLTDACGYGDPTSWLNDLVVLAIEIDGQHAGTSSSTLTYTIQATAP